MLSPLQIILVVSIPLCLKFCLFVFVATAPQWAMDSPFTRFLDHTQRRIIVGRTPLDEWSARRRDLYLTTHNSHNRQTSKPPVGFEPAISAGEQTYALDLAATATGVVLTCVHEMKINMNSVWHNCMFLLLLFYYWLLVSVSKGHHLANIYKKKT